MYGPGAQVWVEDTPRCNGSVAPVAFEPYEPATNGSCNGTIATIVGVQQADPYCRCGAPHTIDYPPLRWR